MLSRDRNAVLLVDLAPDVAVDAGEPAADREDVEERPEPDAADGQQLPARDRWIVGAKSGPSLDRTERQ